MLEAVVDDFYERAGSLFVDAYDAFYSSSDPQLANLVAFYERLAHKLGGHALEIACGTGRITLPLAQSGIDVVGVDKSEAMLAIAARKLTMLPAAVQHRTTFLRQDMTALSLDQRFGLVFVPARSFQHVLTVERQRKSLEAFRHHLEPAGRLVLQLFDPRLDFLIDANTTMQGLCGTHPESGQRYSGEVLRTTL